MTRATFYSSTLAWHLTPAYRWIVRPLLIVAIPAGCGLILLGLFSLLGRGFRLDPPAWVAGSGIALISLGLVTLPWSEVRAILGMGSGPGWHGSHTEGVLIYANDHLGSTRVIIDTVGQPVETRDYAPFGRTIAHTGNFALKHQFTSQPYDEANGLQYHGARMYDPRWGRWLSADEALEGFDAQGLNPYAYVRNQPTSRIDPTGALSWGWPGAIPWSPTLQSDGAGRTNNATDSSPVRFGRGQEAIGWYNAGSDFYAQAGSEDGGGPRSEFDGRTGELIGYRYPDGTLIGERNSFDDVVRPTLRVGRLNVALPDRIAIGLLVGSPLVLGFDLAVDIRDLANIRVETLNIRLGFGAAGALSIRSLGLVTTFGEMAGPQSPLQLGAIVAGQLPGVPLGGAVDVRVGSDLRGASVTGGAGIVFGGAVCAPCVTGSVPIRAPRPGAAHQGEMP